MVRLQLDERRWQKVKAALGVRKRAGRPGRDDRNFVEAVLWWRRTGAPLRDLPSDFGPWKTVFNRFDRWASKGIWQHDRQRPRELVGQMTPTTWQSLDDPVRQHQKLQRQVVDIQSFVIELHHAPSVTRLAGCLSHRRPRGRRPGSSSHLRGQLPAARACLARATQTQAYQPPYRRR